MVVDEEEEKPPGFFRAFRSFFPVRRSLFSHPWIPSQGFSLAFHLDGLSLLFALLITGTGSVVVVYSGGYLKGSSPSDGVN
ncbi:MAG: hypothetical protein KF693_00460 [Nitrospira sp.]|nr:hypothetical protein [Nitrospira sp.]